MKLLTFCWLLSSAAALSVWPAPKTSTNGSSVVWIAENLQVSYNGANVRLLYKHIPYVYPFSSYENDTELFFLSQLHKRTDGHPHGGSGNGCKRHGDCGEHDGRFSSQKIVEAAVERAKKTIFQEKFVPWKFHPRNTIEEHEPAPHGVKKTYLKKLEITQTGTDDESTYKPLAGQVDESYNFTLVADGTASLTAVSSTGVLRGLETFTQLWYLHSKPGVGYYCNQAPISIQDAPRWKHRGLNLDLARNWMPKENVFRQIDALAWNKFNRLHIHMTDAQSWPMDIPSMPELSQKGAYQTGLSYTPKDIEDFHTYAVYRGIEILIEFDMPGHTSSIAYSHPELITAFRAEPWDYYCAEPPCGALKLNSTPVYDFLEKLWNDVLPRVNPYTAYFHTGGDEVNRQDFMLDETVRSNETQVLRPLLQKFVDYNHKKVREAGLTPVVWEEMALEPWNLNLGKDVVVQTWQTDEALFNATRDGYQALFGNYNFWVSTLTSSLVSPHLIVLLAPLFSLFSAPLLTHTPVSRLRPRPMAQLRKRRLLPTFLPLP